mgnify:CR=1 FL=1
MIRLNLYRLSKDLKKPPTEIANKKIVLSTYFARFGVNLAPPARIFGELKNDCYQQEILETDPARLVALQ